MRIRIGDMIRIPNMKYSRESLPLWDDPPDFTSIYRKNHVGYFQKNDTGLTLGVCRGA